MAKLIPPYVWYGLAVTIRKKEYDYIMDKCVLDKRRVRKILPASAPYHWCFQRLVAEVMKIQSRIAPNLRVDFIFDENKGNFERCVKWFRKIYKEMPAPLQKIMGTITPANDKEVMPLQAADLLVGQINYNFRARHADKPYKYLSRCTNIFWAKIELSDLTNFNLAIQYLNVVASTEVLSNIKEKVIQHEKENPK
jgi:hypothetical protein